VIDEAGEARDGILARAELLAESGRIESASVLYQELLRANPQDVDGMCGLSYCLTELSRHQEGLQIAERAAGLAPDVDWPHRLRSAHLLGLGRPRDALRAAEEAVRLHPNGPLCLLILFEAQCALKDAKSAAQTARAIRQIDPEQAEAHNAVGRAAMLRRDWLGAERAFREALRLQPQESVYQSNLALALEQRGHISEALELFEQAVRTNPDSAHSRGQLAGAIWRRLWIGGVGASTVVGLGQVVRLGLQSGFSWDLVGIGALLTFLALVVFVPAALLVRWLRLRRLPRNVRRLYQVERANALRAVLKSAGRRTVKRA
jgi:tetratricopeptide (TPR) repeat protein